MEKPELKSFGDRVLFKGNGVEVKISGDLMTDLMRGMAAGRHANITKAIEQGQKHS